MRLRNEEGEEEDTTAKRRRRNSIKRICTQYNIAHLYPDVEYMMKDLERQRTAAEKLSIDAAVCCND